MVRPRVRTGRSKQRARHTAAKAGATLQTLVADSLRKRMQEGTLTPGMKLPAFRTIADEFDVSTMTVVKAIEMLDRENLIYRMHGVGAFVRPKSHDSKLPVRRLLALTIQDMSSPFTIGIARSIERSCYELGWGVQAFNADLDLVQEQRDLQRIADQGAQGAIIMPPCAPACIDQLARLRRTGFPLVFIDQTIPGMEGDFAASDHEAGAYQATNYLLKHGHRQIWIVTHPPVSTSIAGRIQGYELALRDAGVNPLPEWKIWIDQDIQRRGALLKQRWLGAYQAALAALRGHRPLPIAILALDAYVQWGVYEACRELGLKIPSDVSVIGFDDSEITHLAQPRMTFMSQRTEEIGRAAVEMLLRRIEARNQPEPQDRISYAHELVGVDLIERESVASIAPPTSEST